ncbi:hypothetical protein H6G33_00240 [Calothrix sp. FACHB-1219]|uniref:hypothetical protein n=1 Tax=unclassified Calothrix TaxID=2619626 RepID=UPI001686D625|nr:MULTISPECIES: hypothetical protein [unclassified Calothrix]MBD2201031.1 hypothetical protein [Calothrix sp. FACHB-168]MBD2215464.1 hypothetical protein [Calothrix sp. FACHB-1219]
MFLLLSRVLLWLLIGTVVYSFFQRFYPTGSFVGRLVIVIMLIVLALAFINPNEPAVASLWRLISFPLKPLGASVLMLIFAAQRIKGGGIDKPGGYLLGWALTILLLASTPAIAYFLVRSPIATTANYPVENVRLAAGYQLAPTSETLVASLPQANANVSDVIAMNPLGINVPPYLLQNPQEIRTRGLRLEDFVPSAETLQVTTNAWESYLNQIYFFLRGRQS